MKAINLLLIIVLSLIFGACSSTKQVNFPNEYLENIEQKPYLYIDKKVVFDDELQLKLYEDFLIKYFKPWEINQISYPIDIATWAFEYKNKDVYGENHKLISKEWFDNIIDNSNFEQFNTLSKKAITIRHTNLRALPTNSVLFYNPLKAGEGFPFDYNQNSSIKPNIPLFVSHLSKDGLWAFVESNLALGWIKITDIGFVDSDFIQQFKTGDYFMSYKDDTHIYKNSYIVDTVELGTLFPNYNDKFILPSKDYKHQAYIDYIDHSLNFAKMPLIFNLENIKILSDELIGQRYGWGGLYGHRDCSAMIRDFYAPFGIFLQRNSGDQKKDGLVHEIGHLSNDDKKDFIIKNGVPFLTIVYLRGHTMIYIGHVDKEPLVFHNVWGIRVLEEDGSVGRYIVGKAIVSTLELGKELPNSIKDGLLIDRVESITLIAVQ